jgi:hypothetical protein
MIITAIAVFINSCGGYRTGKTKERKFLIACRRLSFGE